MEEFFERLIWAPDKLILQFDNIFKETWFLKELKRKIDKYVALLPIIILKEALHLVKKIELNILRNEKSYDIDFEVLN